MQIISISRGSYSRGKEFAECLARKLDFRCLSREELLEEATRRGIPVGKMETAIVKPHTFIDRFGQVKEHYKALATSMLCQRALEGNLVYHGRTGHLLLPGLDNVLRVRVVADMESRIESVEKRLGISRRKAQDYILQVEEDRRRWAKIFYDVDWDETTHYDIIVNTDKLSVENGATALCAMAELPEFKLTPASRKVLDNLHLSARCRLALFDEDRTYEMMARVRADCGAVSVTYPPRQAPMAGAIQEVLREVPGVREITCTMAQTTILWVQENFDSRAATVDEVIQIANKWDAAVELVKLVPGEAGGPLAGGAMAAQPVEEVRATPRALNREYTGGIDDDGEEAGPRMDEDLKQIHERLLAVGRSGGGHVIRGSPRGILHSREQGARYSLVILGSLFAAKGHATQTRLTNELAGYLLDQLKVPVVMAGELKKEYLFGRKQLAILLSYSAVVALVFWLVFSYQIPTLEATLLQGPWRILSVALILALVLLISHLYGTATKLLLKLFRFE